jgi:hypothetical protein
MRTSLTEPAFSATRDIRSPSIHAAGTNHRDALCSATWVPKRSTVKDIHEMSVNCQTRTVLSTQGMS